MAEGSVWIINYEERLLPPLIQTGVAYRLPQGIKFL